MDLARYRREHGMTLAALGEKVGVTSRALWQIERGRGCRLRTAVAIVAATGGEVTLLDLLNGATKPAPAAQEATPDAGDA